jgi:hypothetical protein
MAIRLILCGVFLMASIAACAQVGVKRSDVVFMGAKSADVYQAYAATMVSWGGHAWQDSEKAIDSFRQRVNEAHDLGMRYCPGLAFRTAFASMIDFDEDFMDSVCRRLDGEPILVPWLWDHKHKDGHPAYWFCTNAPGYREYLRHQTRLAMVTDVEGLHIDDYNGTAGTEWQGGCFCEHCMSAFRDYLQENVSPARLKECGVQSLDAFDYGQFLRDQGVTVEDYRRKVGSSIPLGPEYLAFQYRAAAAWVGEIRRYAEQLAGHPLMLSVNSSASGPKSLFIAPHLTYFCGEVPRDASSLQVPTNPVFVFKLADALGTPQVSTASGQDWAYVMEQAKPGLVRTWIAQAYAYGHQLMCPHRQWAYTREKGTHWYESQPEDYAHLYQFVRRYPELFDDYDAIAPVGLVYSNAAFRSNKTAAREACVALARANVPFRLLLAGDDWMDDRLAAAHLADLSAIVVTEPLMLDEQQQAVLDAARDRVVTWPDEQRLAELLPAPIALEGAENVTVIPRAVPGDDSKPFVCHLLNRDYVGETDSMTPQSDFRLTLARSLFAGAAISKAILCAPEREPLELQFTQSDEHLEVQVPELDLWGVLRLDREQQ